MARKATWPPRVQRHRASGQARVRVRSKDYYLGVYGSDQAKRAYVALLDRLGGAEAPPAAGRRARDELVILQIDPRARRDRDGGRFDDARPVLRDFDDAGAVHVKSG